MDNYVSIITPVYNVDKYLARCIESILAQNYTNWELILIDDGSLDSSGIICDQFAQKSDKIRVIHQTNQGVSVARNIGLEVAKGDYILFVDPDDWIASDMLETMISVGNGAELVVCGFTNVFLNDDGTETEEVNTIWKDMRTPFISVEPYYDVLCKTATVWNKLFRKDTIEQIKFIPGMTYGEDSVFVAFALRNIHSAIIVPQPYYYYYRNRKGSVVSSEIDERSMEFLDNGMIIYEELKKQKHGSFGVYRLYVVVGEILSKISIRQRIQYQDYLKKCCFALRKTAMKDRIDYVFDKRFGLHMGGKIFFLLAPYSHVLLLFAYNGRS